MQNTKQLLTVWLLNLLVCESVQAVSVYQNTFDSGAASLAGWTGFGSGSISVSSGQLTFGLTGYANAGVSLNMAGLSPLYSSVIRLNSGVTTWAVNIANQDGPPNNMFNVVLACNSVNPYDISSVGYALMGGGFVGDRMMFYRFDHGLGGGGRIVIDIPSTNGLGTLPAKGSFKITYDPSGDNWAVFGQIGTSYVDPTLVSVLMGSGVDSTYTGGSMPYFSLAGLNGGADYFDNLSIAVVPEPSSLGIIAIGGVFLVSSRKRLTMRSSEPGHRALVAVRASRGPGR